MLSLSNGVRDPAISAALRQLEIAVSKLLAKVPVDGDWSATSSGGGGGLSDGDKGDVTVSGGGGTWTVDALPESRITGLTGDLTDLRSSVMYIDVKREYGAVGDGVTDDRTAITNALSAAATAIAAGAGRVVVYFPAGTYFLTNSGGTCLTIPADRVTLRGAGKRVSVLYQGPTTAQTSIIVANERTGFEMHNLGVDGGWGNAVTYIDEASTHQLFPGSGGSATITVKSTTGFPASGTFKVVTVAGTQTITYTGKTATTFTGCTGGTGTMIFEDRVGWIDVQTGNNHTTQADPKNRGVFIRGCTDTLIDDCHIENTYGDGIWIGYSSSGGGNQNRGSILTRILNTDINLPARDGITAAGKAECIRVDNCRVTNVYAQAFDTEPQGGLGVRDVEILNTTLEGWWNPARSTGGQAPLSIVSSSTVTPSGATYARSYRVRNCTIYGQTLIQGAHDLVMEGCRLINSYTPDAGNGGPALVYIVNASSAIKILNNYIYDRTPQVVGGTTHHAAVMVRYITEGASRNQASDVLIQGNTIHVRAGTHGVGVYGASGGATIDNSTYSTAVTGTATGVTGTTMTDGSAAWTTNQWSGWHVRIGTATAAIVTNTATVLTLDTFTGVILNLAWQYPLGSNGPTPAAGAYTIFKPGGFVSIRENTIDCSDDGWGAGGRGIDLSMATGGSGAAGAKIDVEGNKFRNCTADGVFVLWGVPPFRELRIRGNSGFDDQSTPTFTSLVTFSGTPNYLVLELANNIPDSSVAAAVTGDYSNSSGTLILGTLGPRPYAPGNVRSITGTIWQHSRQLRLRGSERITLEGDARLVLSN